MAFVVEYLFILPKNASFCDSTDGFNRLLEVDSSIKIKKSMIRFKDKLDCAYQIVSGELNDKDQRYFQLKFTIDPDEASVEQDIEAFTSLLKAVKATAIGVTKGQIEVLWDDITLYYSEQAYKRIYEIENLMRKLIANFLLITIGKDWDKEATPAEMREAANKQRKERASFLYSIDFIDLTRFLLKPYSKNTEQEIFTKVKKAQTLEELSEVKKLLPQSNWERYFAALVVCEDAWLDTRWKELYELRCMVAHNSGFTKADFMRCLSLISEVKPKLEDALDKLSEVSVPEADRELVAEDAASNSNDLVGAFLTAYNALLETIYFLARNRGIGPASSRESTKSLMVAGVISEETRAEIEIIRLVRNQVVHGSINRLNPDSLRSYVVKIDDMINVLTLTIQYLPKDSKNSDDSSKPDEETESTIAYISRMVDTHKKNLDAE